MTTTTGSWTINAGASIPPAGRLEMSRGQREKTREMMMMRMKTTCGPTCFVGLKSTYFPLSSPS